MEDYDANKLEELGAPDYFKEYKKVTYARWAREHGKWVCRCGAVNDNTWLHCVDCWERKNR